MSSDDRIHRPYGSWESAFTLQQLASGTSFEDLAWGQGGELVWLEKRSGQGLLNIRAPGEPGHRTLNPGLPAGGRVGYGGGAFTVGEGQVFFVASKTGRLYRQPLTGGPARPLTPELGSAASPALSPDHRWLVYVQSVDGVDSLAVVDAGSQNAPRRLVQGDDFYMQPCWHPQGSHLAWVAWDHPHMPWDAARLYLGRLSYDGSGWPVLAEKTVVAGGPQGSVLQPTFSPTGRSLAYLSDAEGWWQVYVYDLARVESRRLTSGPGDIGGPAWIQGLRFYAFSPGGDSLAAIRQRAGFCELWRVRLDGGVASPIPLPEEYTWLEQVALSPADGDIALLASGPASPPCLLRLDASGQARVEARSQERDLPPGLFSRPEPVDWVSEDGQIVHGLFYPPANPQFRSSGAPPLVVHAHSGPTSLANAGFEPEFQFYTSRGYAVLAVNFRGSIGFGRAYWRALYGHWGVADVADVLSGARFLAHSGRVDERRMMVSGSSAGGLTGLLALAHQPGFFRAGVFRYPVVDLLAMEGTTHKFEAHYNRQLIGPFPQSAELYRQRSPLEHATRIQDPLIIFHGADDPVVSPQGSRDLVGILTANGISTQFHLLSGEGHGFKRAETWELYFSVLEAFLGEHGGR